MAAKAFSAARGVPKAGSLMLTKARRLFCNYSNSERTTVRVVSEEAKSVFKATL
jgi:hypothetical protein